MLIIISKYLVSKGSIGITFLIRLMQYKNKKGVYKNISFGKKTIFIKINIDYLNKRAFWSLF